jgi:hypothetical protein
MGNSFSVNDLWCATFNPALFHSDNKFSISVGSHQPYRIKELSRHAIVSAYQSEYYTISGNVAYFGYSQYNVIDAGLGVSVKTSATSYSGVSLLWLKENVPSSLSANRQRFSFSVAFRQNISKRLSFSALIFDPLRTTNNLQYSNNIPSPFGLGLQYIPHPSLLLVSDLGWEYNHTFNFKIGSEWKIASSVCIRAGYKSKRSEMFTGLGFECKNFQCDFALGFHPTLGTTPSISILYNL